MLKRREKEGKKNIRGYLWIVHEGVWAQFHTQRKHIILSRKLVRFATPVTTNFQGCSCNSSTSSLKNFKAQPLVLLPYSSM